ncbi:MAG: hypothetical protein AB7P14_17130 [Blastocatellales bacterium]
MSNKAIHQSVKIALAASLLITAAIAFQNLASAQIAKPYSARVANHNGRPTLFINDQPQFPMLFALTEAPGGRWTWEERPAWNIRQFAERGVRLFEFDVWMEHMWKPDGTLDIDLARRQIRGALDIRPDAAIMLRLHVNAPPWWNQRHPEETVAYANGPIDTTTPWGIRNPLERDLERSIRHSIASEKWKAELTEKTREFCRKLAATPEGDSIYGIHVAAGVYGEWHYYGFMKNDPDTGTAMTAHFRQWLRSKYKTVEALREAWNDPEASFDSAAVPGLDDRLRTSDGYFRDPVKERRVIDYFQCQHERVTDSFLHFCKVVKESWPRPLIVGGFHGYWLTMFGRMAAGGHLAIEKALNSPDVDFLCAPQSYDHRHIGQSGPSRGVVESALLHGKLWFDEMDHAPFIEEQKDADAKISLANSIGILRRSVAAPFSRGTGMWYYDYGPHKASGWWDHKDLLTEVRRLHELHEEYFNRPFKAENDVLLVFDTESFYFTGNNKEVDPVSTEALDGTTEDLYHSGASFDMVYLFDLDRVRLDQYKAVIFANAFHLNAAQRELIAGKVARNGRHLIWMGAPGFTDGQRLNGEAVSQIVGMKLQRAKVAKARVRVDRPAATFGFDRSVEPLFIVNDPSAEVWGKLEGSNSAALAKKKSSDSTSWFSSVPLRNPELLRNILRTAGAHIYSEGNDVIYNGGGILTVHTLNGGKRTITFRNGRKIETELAPRSTTLFDSETGKNLLP